ncbi:antitoxin MazE family protein [Actinomyces viscosus]|uniref:antitoxin MazE family protein n=1 Tax=Actinomyces viscosus TaxID=1656 RepID=UPI0028EE5AC2|nr:antitoxin MazE family protein [Actinomyces viscosus]
MSVNQRVSAYRSRMRARGYRPVQVWLPDLRRADVEREAQRQALRVAQADQNSDDQEFIEAVSVDWGEE